MIMSLLDGNIGKSAVFNHELWTCDVCLEAQLAVLQYQQLLYEVIRCIDGTPLFLEDHLSRLSASAAGSDQTPDPDIEQLKCDIHLLIKTEKIGYGNIKVIIAGNNSLIFPSVFYYPRESQYAEGVHIGVLNYSRTDPNRKQIKDDYKMAVASKLSSLGPFGTYFETLLCDSDGIITEGSRSNAFFIKDNRVYTAPDNVILKGITRIYVCEAITAAKLEIVYDCINISEIGTICSSAFITGTSIGVLPISSIEETVLLSPQNEKIHAIRREYERIVKRYINEHNN